jgi:protein phosphatase
VKITIPDFCLLAIVSMEESGSTAGTAAFLKGEVAGPGEESWPEVVARRLAERQLVTIDSTRFSIEQRIGLIRLAKRFHARALALLIAGKDWRKAAAEARRLEEMGFRSVTLIRADQVTAVELERVPLAVDLRREAGPFDIIGDIHGCCDELVELLSKLGYRVHLMGSGDARLAEVEPPSGRRAVFVGDFVDRGPGSPDAIRIVMAMTARGQALAVPGNHDVKFLRWLQGHNVRLTHGLDLTAAQFAKTSARFRSAVREFIASLRSHVWLDAGRLVVAHAGIREDMIGRDSGAVREFCIYGDTDGDKDETGLVIRYNWAAHYRGQTTVVYGHTPVAEPEWLNNTVCIDTGCCFGGRLTALRWPEREIVSVAARAVYAVRGRPFGLPPVRPASRGNAPRG